MIDPTKMTRYSHPREKLEETLLFSICVAGKNARTTAVALEKFLGWGHNRVSRFLGWSEGDAWKPFEMLRLLFATTHPYRVADAMRRCGIGCYNQRCKSFRQACESGLDLKKCGVADLEKIHGVAEKTSRFFILHTRRNFAAVPIDTHWMKEVRRLGLTTASRAPKGRRYLELESKALDLIRKSGKTAADFDLELWNRYAGREQSPISRGSRR